MRWFSVHGLPRNQSARLLDAAGNIPAEERAHRTHGVIVSHRAQRKFSFPFKERVAFLLLPEDAFLLRRRVCFHRGNYTLRSLDLNLTCARFRPLKTPRLPSTDCRVRENRMHGLMREGRREPVLHSTRIKFRKPTFGELPSQQMA